LCSNTIPQKTATLKKENEIFLIFKEIQMGLVAVIYEERLPNTVYCGGGINNTTEQKGGQ
jgi:hypothetical protein